MAEIALDTDYEIDALRRVHGFSPVTSEKVHVNDMKAEEADLIRKTIAQMPHISTPIPSSTDASLAGRATLGPVDSAVAEAADPAIAWEAVSEFPNLAWEAIKAGLVKEQITNAQLNAHIKEAEKHQKDIDLLLDFSAELTGHKDDASDLTERAKELIEELKGRGIDLWKGEDKTITKEKISALKDLSNSHVDKIRSNLQILFTTKIQVKIQAIGSIMEALKDIIRNNRKVCDKANQLPGRG